MAVPTIVDATSVANGSATMAVPRPAGLQNGDWVFVIAHGRASSTITTPPANFTELVQFTTGSTASQVRSAVWYKSITDAPNEPATYSVVYDVNPFGTGIAVAVRGAHATLPVAAGEFATATGSGAAIACPSITTGGDERLVFTAPANNTAVASGNTWAPTSATEIEDTGNRIYGALGHVTQATAGTVAAETWTITSASPGAATGLTFAVQPIGANNPPVANAGPDQTGHVGDLITLDGTGSSDAEGIASYAWTQLSGPTVSLSGANTDTATFTPTVASNYSFRLTVTDTSSTTDDDDVNVVIYPAGVNVGTLASATSSAPSAAPPAAAAIGDVAFAFVVHQGNVSVSSYPAGWTPLASSRSGSSSTNAAVAAMYKRLEASDLGASVNVALSANSRWCAGVVTVANLHALHPALRSLYSSKLDKPVIDDLVINGTPGSTTYEYVATAIDEAGETTASTPVSISTGPGALSGTNSINVWFDPIQGATNYRVYGRTSGGPYALIATVDNTNVSGVSTNQKRGITDTGTATTAQNPPATYPAKVHWDCRDADDPGRLRTNFANGLVLHAAALRAPSAAPGFALTSTPANTVILGQHLHSENQVLLAVLYEELSAAGNLLSGRLADFNTATEAWAGTSAILRPMAANGTPTALAGVDRTEFTSTRVYLDASLAYDVDEDELTYAWIQTAGPAVTLNDANTIRPWFITPSTATSLSFQLTVTDPSSVIDTAQTVITVIEPPSVARVYKNGSFGVIQIQTYQNDGWA